MSHPEQLAFIEACVVANQRLLDGARVLEVGSYDVNGSVRGLFGSAADYLGVDLVAGPGVDRVIAGADLDEPSGSFDVAVSAECFEHDHEWRETFANMVRLTRPGGLVIVTCASTGRVEHGTRRTLVSDSPGTQAEGSDYYGNLAASDFDAKFLDAEFSSWRFSACRSTFDLYFAGVRAGGGGEGRLPDEETVARIPGMMPLLGRAVRLPLRATWVLTRNDRAYQKLAVPYWLAMIRLARRLGVGGLAAH